MPHEMTMYECLEELEAVQHETEQLRAMVGWLVTELRASLPTVTSTPYTEIPWRSREAGS